MKQRNFRLFIANLLFFLAIPAVASAAVLEEIVVIAQKREQNLQDVSVTVTAFTGDTIEKLGIQDPRDIANLMPNVAVQTSENTSTFNIRGVQLLDTGDGNESPVSFISMKSIMERWVGNQVLCLISNGQKYCVARRVHYSGVIVRPV